MRLIRHIMAAPAVLAVAVLAFAACGRTADSVCGQRTDALEEETWDCSRWISASDAPVVDTVVVDGSRAADGSSWFVSSVTNGKMVVSAVWMTAGLGVYDLYVNGRLVGNEILKPGFTHPYRTKRSFTYDVTDAFEKAAGAVNMLAVQMTPGWWGDKIVTPAKSEGMVGRKCAFRGVLRLAYSDGSTECFGTGPDSWKAGIAGPVRHAAIFDGEDYDAREPMGYELADSFPAAELNTEFDGDILPSEGAEIYFREDLALKPVKAYIWSGVTGKKDGEFGKVAIKKEFAPGKPMKIQPGDTLVVDFGQNASAVPSFVFSAAAGTVLTCLPAELLNDGNGALSRGMDGPEGSVHRQNLRIPEQGMMLNYTFADSDGPVSFRPRATFFGYRFVSITATADVTISSIESVPVTSITAELETGTIVTGNDLVNKLISNTLWSQRSNYLSVTTDCPQRNERLGWTADTQVFAETGTFFANTDSFFHKWLRDLRDSQSLEGGFPGVAPLAQYDNHMMRLGWADAGVIVPWTVWKQFGDTSVIDESWDSMEKFINHVNETRYDHNVLKEENGDYQWADWLSYEPLESRSQQCYSDDPGKQLLPDAVAYWNYLAGCYWAMDAAMMRDMAAASGRDASKYEAMQAEAVSYLRSKFLTPDGKFKTAILNTMQTPALFALRNRLVEGEAAENMKAALRENFAQHGNCLQTGFLGTSILMSTLTDNGMADIAYELLFQRKNPSWLYSVDNGATTMWERWNSYMLEKGMGPSGMNSFNHYAYGVVCQWIWETAAGIAADVSAPGFKRIIMKPVPDKRLGHLDAEYHSAAGLIRSSWKYEGEKWIWTFSVPDGAVASVTLPGSDETVEYTAGTYTVEQ